jgi:hypothetical protein
MSQDKEKDQSVEQLKKLKDKPLPEHIRKSVDEKIKHTQKPFNK